MADLTETEPDIVEKVVESTCRRFCLPRMAMCIGTILLFRTLPSLKHHSPPTSGLFNTPRHHEQPREPQGHTDRVTSVAFSPHGNRIVSGSNDNSVRVWDTLFLDAPWVVNKDGLILSGAERLVWAPSTISNILLRPHNALTFSWNGSATISFTHCRLGIFCHECSTP